MKIQNDGIDEQVPDVQFLRVQKGSDEFCNLRISMLHLASDAMSFATLRRSSSVASEVTV